MSIIRTEKVIIIIPTYNEEETIEKTLHQIFECTAGIPGYDVHVLVFDSASTDNTARIVTDLQTIYPFLLLQSESTKTGLGSAYQQAMRHALDNLHADIVIEFDADLSHQPKYISGMLETIKACDVVVGSRYIKGGSIPSDWPWYRKGLSVIGNGLTRLCLSRKYKDFTSGFRATRRQMLEKCLPKNFISNHYAYKIELLWRLHQHKAHIVEFPIEFIDRKKGCSKLPANSIVDTLRVLFKLRMSGHVGNYIRMCAVGLVGFCLQFLVYNLLRFTLSAFSASQIAIACAILNNYLLNHYVSFKQPTSWYFYQKAKSLGLFISYSLTIIFCQSYWLHVVIQYIGPGFIKENAVILFTIAFNSILNYLVYSRFIWPSNSRESRWSRREMV